MVRNSDIVHSGKIPKCAVGVDTGFNAPNQQQAPPPLPPRNPPNLTSSPPTSQYSPYQNGSLQQTRLPGPPSTAPPTHAVARSSYNPSIYGPITGARLSPINPTWNQSSHSVTNTDTSKWGVNYYHGDVSKPQSESKPPLPVSDSISEQVKSSQKLNYVVFSREDLQAKASTMALLPTAAKRSTLKEMAHSNTSVLLLTARYRRRQHRRVSRPQMMYSSKIQYRQSSPNSCLHHHLKRFRIIVRIFNADNPTPCRTKSNNTGIPIRLQCR